MKLVDAVKTISSASRVYNAVMAMTDEDIFTTREISNRLKITRAKVRHGMLALVSAGKLIPIKVAGGRYYAWNKKAADKFCALTGGKIEN